MKKNKDNKTLGNTGEDSSRRIFLRKLVLCAGGITITRTMLAGTDSPEAAMTINEDMDFINNMPEQTREAVEILKQLQAYDPKVLTDLMSKLPKNVVVLSTKQNVQRGSRYLTQTITIKDADALEKLNMSSKLSGASRDILQAGKLLQQSTVMVDPQVISETKNILPEGMVSMSPGATANGVNIGVNFNLGRVQRLNESSWAPVNIIK
jgi:hypothetical protein